MRNPVCPWCQCVCSEAAPCPCGIEWEMAEDITDERSVAVWEGTGRKSNGSYYIKIETVREVSQTGAQPISASSGLPRVSGPSVEPGNPPTP